MEYLLFDVVKVKATYILQPDALEQILHPCLGIRLGRISRQTLQVHTCGSPFCQNIFDGLTAMHPRSIPDHQDVARDLTHEGLEEAHTIRPLDEWSCVYLKILPSGVMPPPAERGSDEGPPFRSGIFSHISSMLSPHHDCGLLTPGGLLDGFHVRSRSRRLQWAR